MECSYGANQKYNKVFGRTFLYPPNERLGWRRDLIRRENQNQQQLQVFPQPLSYQRASGMTSHNMRLKYESPSFDFSGNMIFLAFIYRYINSKFNHIWSTSLTSKSTLIGLKYRIVCSVCMIVYYSTKFIFSIKEHKKVIFSEKARNNLDKQVVFDVRLCCYETHGQLHSWLPCGLMHMYQFFSH